MSKNILVINGHHRDESFVGDICETYINSARNAGANIEYIKISSMKIDPFKTEFPGEKVYADVENTQNKIKWADHIVFAFPIWWYAMPSKMKAFIENVFVSGFAFKYKKSKNFVQWDKYLTGKSAHVFSTMDNPVWYYKLLLGQPSFKTLRASLNFCGIRPVKVNHFGSVKMSDEKLRAKWLAKVEKIAAKSA